MEKILRIPFTEIDTADLLVDAVYEGGTAKNLGSEVLSKVMHVGNSGGFRKCIYEQISSIYLSKWDA